MPRSKGMTTGKKATGATAGVHKRPSGRAPMGKKWDAQAGRWIQTTQIEAEVAADADFDADTDDDDDDGDDDDVDATDATDDSDDSDGSDGSEGTHDDAVDDDAAAIPKMSASPETVSSASSRGSSKAHARPRSRASCATSTAAAKLRKRPPGRAPAGKAWDAQDGQWADAVDDLADDATLPRGSVAGSPRRKRRAASFGAAQPSSLRSTAKRKAASGPSATGDLSFGDDAPLFAKPAGRAPNGTAWNWATGEWDDAQDDEEAADGYDNQSEDEQILVKEDDTPAKLARYGNLDFISSRV